MSITIQNLRIIPYGQKDVIKPVFGDTMHLTFRLADAPMEGDRYLLGLDYERILFPTMRPLCAYTEDYTASQNDVSFDLGINTERFALWVSGLKKPTPIWLQLIRVRDGEYTTILLDDILALPSPLDGANMVFPGTPLEDELAKKLDKPAEAGETGNVLKLGEDGEPFWGEGGGGGSAQQATDAEIDARQSQTHTITPNNLEYATRSVLDNITAIDAATTLYYLVDASATTNSHSWTFVHSPSVAPTYVFPAVTDATTVHRIDLIIDFASVQTYSFEDAQGDPILPLFTPSISAGDVYAFRCEWSSVQSKWLIYPCKQGAVSDDYVMQSQVGAANGVAGLSSSGVVPVAQLPMVGYNQRGIGSVHADYGTGASSGRIAVYAANDAEIAARAHQYKPIVPYRLNYAVTAALTDSNKISLTDEQKASAQDTLGVWSPPVTVIPAATTQYTLGEGLQSHVPDSAPTYTLPAVTNNARTHECILTIRFSSSVQTYAFEDSVGNPITPLPLAGTIADGSVVAFRCTWEALLNQWVIMPVMLGTYVEATP